MSLLDERIDDACDEFEAEWKAGREPRIETYLAQFPDLAGRVFFVELLKLDLEYRRGRGEDPGPEAYEGRFPGYIEAIRAEFGATEPEVETPDRRFHRTRFLARGGLGDVYIAQDIGPPIQ